MATPHYHKERFSELLHREIASVISHELRDPRIPALVTITKINIGADLRNATVFVSVFNDNNQSIEQSINALNKAAPYIQRLVASRVVIKHFPKLYFKHDDGINHTQHINELLKEVSDDLG